MNYLKKILVYALPYKRYAFLNIFFNILYALFGTLSFVVLIPMLKVIFPTKNEVTIAKKPIYKGLDHLKDFLSDTFTYNIQSIAHDDKLKALTIVIILVISTFLFKNVFNYLALYFGTFLRNGILKNLRNAIYKRTIDLPISFFSEKRKGDIMARIAGDVGEVQNSFLSVLEIIVREPLTIIFSIAAMLIISPKLTIFIFVFLPVAGFIISAIAKRLRQQSSDVQVEQGIFLSIVEETLNGLKIVKGYNAQAIFNNKFQESTSRFFSFSNKMMHRQNIATPLSEFLGIVTIAFLLWFGGNMVISGAINAESFLAFMGLSYNILTPIKALSKANNNVKRGNAAAERVLEIIESENPLKDKANAIIKEKFNSEIKFKNISFKYENEYVLKNFSLTIPKGQTVALVGQSGSGKSTIANLITRFYDVNKGAILLDGIDIRDLTTSSLRNQLGIVTQDAILFNESIKNNMRLLVNENVSDEAIIDALKVANAWEFVKDLPKGINTNIGDSGNKLSGGQKQRISIARAVLKNPPIMVLDEATSALDTESERLVQVALENMMRNRTSIVIAHRLSTIQNADLIAVMQKGEIIEQGKHNELITKNGMYKRLVEMQSFE